MTRSIIITTLLVLMAVPSAGGQSVPQNYTMDHREVPSISANSVSTMASRGDTLWAGSLLNMTTDGGQTWTEVAIGDITDERYRVFSMDARGDVAIVGLGFNTQSLEGSVQSAGGFLFSDDGGRSFAYRFPQTDTRIDTVVVFGDNRLRALPAVDREEAPPYDVAIDPLTGDLWVAGWSTGVRRSSDEGETWERIVLPPDNLTEIDPQDEYDFIVGPRRGGLGHINHLGFSVLADSRGNVWAGTPAGINRRLAGEERWQRFSASGAPNALVGSWVIAIDEMIHDGESIIWMATWNAGETGEAYRDGITMTRDAGETFEKVLIGERIYDFAFRDGTVYAAGEAGLFVSHDLGATWETIRDFNDPTGQSRRVRLGLPAFAVETTRSELWVGTSDGLAVSTDEGGSWRTFRAEIPLSPDEPTDRVPDVETFAYPNPFSPNATQFVRIRFDGNGASSARINIFDFEMRLVRTLDHSVTSDAIQEAVWDGRSSSGLRVANGPYIYIVDVDGNRADGKILVVE